MNTFFKLLIFLLSTWALKALDSSCYALPANYKRCVNDAFTVPNLGLVSFDSPSFTSVTLNNKQRETNGVWITNPYYWQNGFSFTFRYKKDYPSIPLTCVNNPLPPAYCFKDGLAVVLQGSGVKKVGYGSSGLGYQFLRNVLAIEFDFKFNSELHDPAGPHISIHKYANKDATADELNSIAYCFNTQLSSFFSDKVDNVVNILYENNELKVYLNSNMMLSYMGLDIAKEFGSVPLYLTVTDSTGDSQYQRTTFLDQFNLQLFRWSKATTNAYLTSSNNTIQQGTIFSIGVDLKNLCGNLVTPDPYLGDAIDDITWPDAAINQCTILQKDETFKTPAARPTYKIFLRCSKAGNLAINLKYKTEMLATPVNVIVVPGRFSQAAIVFPANNTGTMITISLDEVPYTFFIYPKDINGNIVDKDDLNLLWKNAIPSPNAISYKKQGDGTWTAVIGHLKAGRYSFKSGILDRAYYLTVKPGSPSQANSYAVITQDSPLKTLTINDKVIAGSTVTVNVILRDKSDSVIELTADHAVNTKMTLTYYNATINLQDPIFSDKNIKQSAQLTKSTDNIFAIYYKGIKIPTCNSGNLPNCTVKVIPTDNNLPKYLLFWTTLQGSLLTEDHAWYSSQQSNLGYWLQQRDIYLNPTPGITDAKKYSAVLSGNQMNPLNLVFTQQGNYAQIDISAADLTYARRLVTSAKYILTLKNIPDNGAIREWPINIVSGRNDLDAGNGKVEPLNTILSCDKNSINAGLTVTCQITLKTPENLRYNDWLPISNLVVSVDLTNSNEVLSQVTALSLEGTYSFTYTPTKAEKKIISVAVMGIIGKNAKAPLNVVSAGLFKCYIIDSDLKPENKSQLKPGNITDDYSFTVKAEDKFGNPTSILSDIRANSIAIPYTIPMSGSYYYTITSAVTKNIAGQYLIQSRWFKAPTPTAYTLNLVAGIPSALKSNATLTTATKSNPINAGVEVTYIITPIDEYGNGFTANQINNFLQLITISVESAAISNDQYKVIDNGAFSKISYKTSFPKIGSYDFISSMKKDASTIEKIPCVMNEYLQICKVDVIADDVDITKTTSYLLYQNTKIELSRTKNNLIDNNKIVSPIFLLSFFDKYGNQRSNIDKLGNSPAANMKIVKSNTYYFKGSIDGLNYRYTMEKNDGFGAEASGNGTLTYDVINFEIPISLKGNSTFSNEPPTEDSVTLTPLKTPAIVKAGTIFQFAFDLKSPDGAYYSKGNYDNPSSAIKIKIQPSISPITNVQANPIKGSYLVSMNITKTDIYKIQVDFLNPADQASGKYLTSSSFITLTVIPNDLAYLVPINSDLSECAAGTTRSFIFTLTDIYYNTYDQSPSLQVAHQPSECIINENSFYKSTATLAYTFTCAKSGNVQIIQPQQHLKFMLNKAEAQLAFVVAQGPLSPEKTCASLSSNLVEAGNKVTLTIKPFDNHGNNIIIDTRNPPDVLFASYIIDNDATKKVSLGQFAISNDKKYYYLEVDVKKAGKYQFSINYNKTVKYIGSQCSTSSELILIVNPSIPKFQKCKLVKKDSNTVDYIPYNDVGFSHNIALYPEFRLWFYDEFDNQISIDLIKVTWKVNLKLFNQDTEFFIPFDTSVNYKFTVSTDPTTSSNWQKLIPGQYKLNLTSESEIQQYKINLTGTLEDPFVSNLPIQVQNTYIYPNPLKTIAGMAATLYLEIRTTDPLKRKNEWFADPMKNISIKFSKNDNTPKILNYSITKKPDQKGAYLIKITGSKTYTEADPNKMTFTINNILYTGSLTPNQPAKTVDLIIYSESQVYKWSITDQTFNQLYSDLPSQTVDDKFSGYFKAFDRFDNIIDEYHYPLSPSFNLNPSSYKDYSLEKVADAVRKISFQPLIPADFKITTLDTKQTFTVKITSGKLAFATSYGTVFNKSSILAGENGEIYFYPKDQWGNTVIIDLIDVNYNYIPPKGNFIKGSEAPSYIDNSYAKFQQILAIKGLYLFKIQYKGQDVPMRFDSIMVVPAASDISQSKLYYYDNDINQFSYWDPKTPIQEKNKERIPIYKLIASDRFGNEFDAFPDNEIQYYKMALNTIPLVNYQINVNGGLSSNSLYFTISDNTELTNYKSIPYSKDLYILKLSQTNLQKFINYNIQLLGSEEEGGTDEEDLSQTVMQPVNLSVVAGAITESNKIYLEFRTKKGKRKTNMAIQESDMTYIFKPSEGFKASIVPGDIPGKFVLIINSTKSTYNKNPATLEILFNHQPLPNISFIKVSPNIMDHFYVSPNPLPTDNTDCQNYIIQFTSYDALNNLAFIDNINSESIIKVTYPTSQSQFTPSYTVTKQADTFTFKYAFKTVVAGTYRLQSKYFTINNSVNDTINFIIEPGAISPLFTTFQIRDDTILSGESSDIIITPFDSYNNRILLNQKQLSQIKLSILANGPEHTETPLDIQSDLSNNLYNSKIYLTKSGVTQMTLYNNASIYFDKKQIKCETGPLDISKTKFFLDNKEITILQLLQGSKKISISAKLFDKFGNLIENLDIRNYTYEATFFGNNMNNMTLDITGYSAYITLNSKSNDEARLSRLISASNYNILFNVINQANNYKASLDVSILGNSSDGGNGDYVLSNTFITPSSLTLIAGEIQIITFEFRTSENKRFVNDLIDPSNIKINEDSKILNLQETMTISTGLKENSFSINIECLNATIKSRTFYLYLNNNKINIPINIIKVIPNIPFKDFTIITQNLPQNVTYKDQKNVTIKLFDQYRNEYPVDLYDVCQYIKINVLVGISTITPNGYGPDNTCLIEVIPLAPPISLEFDIFWVKTNSDKTTTTVGVIAPNTIKADILTYLAPSNTEIYGDHIEGVPVDEDFIFYVKLVDNIGTCFWDSRTVYVNITGPYLNAKDNNLMQNAEILYSWDNVKANSTKHPTINNCNVYQVIVPKESIHSAGLYQIQVSIIEEKVNPVAKFRKTQMTAGKTYPMNCLLTMAEGQANVIVYKENDTVSVRVNSKVEVQLQKYDKFNNIIQDLRSGIDTVDFNTSSTALLYTKNVSYLQDGLYKIVFSVSIIGFTNFQFIINGAAIKLPLMKRKSVPPFFYIRAGACDIGKSLLQNSQVIGKSLPIGNVSFSMECFDEFGNRALPDYYNFSASIRLSANIISYYLTPATNVLSNIYNISFAASLSGVYSIQVILDKINFKESFTVNVSRVICNSDTPYWCEKLSACVESIYKCGGMEDVDPNCPSSTPFNCSVKGVTKCVAGLWECDCPAFQIKCVDNKCVPQDKYDDLCPTLSLMSRTCENGFFLCKDGNCRATPYDCPSQHGCPPGYRLCPDLSCTKKGVPCSTFDACPDYDVFYKCNDQSCQMNFEACSAMITCPKPGQIVCPDQSCADSEINCKIPPDCTSLGQILCSSNVCRKERKDCPQYSSCFDTYAKCVDGQCALKCATPPKKFL